MKSALMIHNLSWLLPGLEATEQVSLVLQSLRSRQKQKKFRTEDHEVHRQQVDVFKKSFSLHPIHAFN